MATNLGSTKNLRYKDASLTFFGHLGLSTEHPHKLLDLIFKEQRRIYNAQTFNYGSLRVLCQ